jgi:hypothetical protein
VTYLDNPAGRLLALFQAARRIDQATAATKGWSHVFGIETGDNVQFVERVGLMFKLAQEVRVRVEERVDEDPTIILEHFSQVEQTLENFFTIGNKHMQQFLANLDPRSGEYSLKLCSSILHRVAPELPIETDQAEDLRRQVEELIDETLSADDLEASVRAWLVKRLNEIRDVLINLKLHGAPGLELAKDRLVGGLAGKPSRIASLRDSKIAKSVAAFIVAVDVVVNFGANFRQLTATEPPKPSPIVIEIERQMGTESSSPALPPASKKHKEDAPG